VNVLIVAPLLASNPITVVLLKSVTQIFAPSKQIPTGPAPAANVPRTLRSLVRDFVTLFVPKFDVQMFVPSNTTPDGDMPVGKIPSNLPSLARSLLTLEEPLLAIRLFAPSKAHVAALLPPIVKVPSVLPSLARNLCNCVGVDIGDPHFGSVKTNSSWTGTTVNVPSSPWCK